MKPLNFGERMAELRRLRLKNIQDKLLLDQFQNIPSMTAKIEKHLVFPGTPINTTDEVKVTEVVVESQTPLERTIQRLRDQTRSAE